jgi:hypothetical protein
LIISSYKRDVISVGRSVPVCGPLVHHHLANLVDSLVCGCRGVLQAAIGATVKFADREWGVGYLAQDGWPQTRSRVFQTNKINAAIKPATMSIQF